MLTLLFLSPAVGELVSGSSPPLEFFNPIGLAGLLALYGCGALLVRDAVLRWGKGWLSLILLGCAYGVYEEGMVVKSWFDPGWMDLGVLGVYGRVGGVNWVWAVWLTVYHATISIALPIFMTGVLFPDLKTTRLLSGRATKWALFFFALTLPVFAFVALPYWGGPEHLLAVILAAGFVAAAWYAPRDFLVARASSPPRRLWPFAAFGFAFIFGAFLSSGLAAAAGVYFGVTVAFIVAFAVGSMLILRAVLHPATAERCLFAFFAGALGVFILIGFIEGIAQPVAFFGMPVVSVATAAWLVRLYRRNLPGWRAAEAAWAVPAPYSTPATAAPLRSPARLAPSQGRP